MQSSEESNWQEDEMNAFYTRNQQSRSAGESLASLRWVCLWPLCCSVYVDRVATSVRNPLQSREGIRGLGAGLGEEFEDDFGPDDQLANRSPSLPRGRGTFGTGPGGEEGGEMGFTDEGGTEVDENAESPRCRRRRGRRKPGRKPKRNFRGGYRVR